MDRRLRFVRLPCDKKNKQDTKHQLPDEQRWHKRMRWHLFRSFCNGRFWWRNNDFVTSSCPEKIWSWQEETMKVVWGTGKRDIGRMMKNFDDKDIKAMRIVYSPTQCICCWGRRRRSWCHTCDPGTQPRRTCPKGNSFIRIYKRPALLHYVASKFN